MQVKGQVSYLDGNQVLMLSVCPPAKIQRISEYNNNSLYKT